MGDPKEAEGSESFEYMGYRICMSHVVGVGEMHESFLTRLLSAGSAWGVQDDLWDWSVSDGGTVLTSDQGLSKAAALEEARYWVRCQRTGTAE
jgi:hypothetical protein